MGLDLIRFGLGYRRPGLASLTFLAVVHRLPFLFPDARRPLYSFFSFSGCSYSTVLVIVRHTSAQMGVIMGRQAQACLLARFAVHSMCR